MGKVTIETFPDGRVKIDAAGFKGDDCSAATKFLSKIGHIKKSIKKRESHELETIDTSL